MGVTSLQPDPALELDVTLELGHLLLFQYGNTDASGGGLTCPRSSSWFSPKGPPCHHLTLTLNFSWRALLFSALNILAWVQ